VASVVEFIAPNESDFSEHLSVRPIESTPEYGYWCYEFHDSTGTTLRLSFDVTERSLQTLVMCEGREILRICQEGATLLSIIDMDTKKVLRGECVFKDAKTTVEIVVVPHISVSWSTLRTE
jgi:hypothetical protein